MDPRRWSENPPSHRQQDHALELLEADNGEVSEDGSFAMDHQGPANSSKALSVAERRSLVMLFALYFVHSIPMAFSWSTMPVLLRQQASYLTVGSFVLVQYPYSLKVFWSPIVETYYWARLGRRKSWLVPGYLCIAALMWLLALRQDELVRMVAADSPSATFWLLTAWFGLSFSCANIRIALDAWALELLSAAGTEWFGLIVNVAETIAYFIAFNVFLGLAFLETSSVADETAVKHASVRGFFMFISIAAVMTAGLILLKREGHRIARPGSLQYSYSIILGILRLPQIWTIFAVHMVSLVGFVTADMLTVLQLVKNGFSDSDIAGIATISAPFAVFAGVWVSRWFQDWHPLQVWRFIFPFRLLNAVVAQVGVMLIYTFRGHAWRWYIAIIPDALTVSLEAAMVVCLITYHAEISDPRHGAIYLPLLTVTLDLRYPVLQFVSTKAIGILDGAEDVQTARLVDGYQIVNATCVIVAMPLFWYYLRPATVWLQSQSAAKWRVDRSPTAAEL